MRCTLPQQCGIFNTALLLRCSYRRLPGSLNRWQSSAITSLHAIYLRSYFSRASFFAGNFAKSAVVVIPLIVGREIYTGQSTFKTLGVILECSSFLLQLLYHGHMLFCKAFLLPNSWFFHLLIYSWTWDPSRSSSIVDVVLARSQWNSKWIKSPFFSTNKIFVILQRLLVLGNLVIAYPFLFGLLKYCLVVISILIQRKHICLRPR